MRRAVIVWMGLLIVGCSSSPKQLKQTDLQGQKIEFVAQKELLLATDTIRFGRMHEGEIAVKQLVFKNSTPQPIVIKGYERTCGCTTLDHDNQPLMPGEERAVSLTFDARGAWGWQLKALTLQLAGPVTSHRLVVEADIE